MIENAIAFFHDQLARGSTAAETHQFLTEQQLKRNISIGNRPLCRMLRPRFLSKQLYTQLQSLIQPLASAFQKATQRALQNPSCRRTLGLQDWEEQSLSWDAGFSASFPIGRFDAFLQADGSFQISELNSDAPAGAAYMDALSDLFKSLPVFQRFQQKHPVSTISCRCGITETLLRCYEQWQGHRNIPPNVAIIDWHNVPTASEFPYVSRSLEAAGIWTVIAEPDQLEYHSNQLAINGKPIHVIYKRVLFSELIERCGLDHPLIRAVRNRAVCMVNPFSSRIAGKKALLAQLSEQGDSNIFTRTESLAIRSHLPWTRLVVEGHTNHKGKSIDLIPHLLAHPREFVLKPNDNYGGRGVVIGSEVDAHCWEKSILHAISVPTVVQQRIDLPRELFPSHEAGSLQLAEHFIDMNPFLAFETEMVGCLNRISSSLLVNVSAGASSAVPTFLIDA